MALTFFQAACRTLMLAVVLWHLNVHALVLWLHGALTTGDFLAWLLYSALDVDGDDPEGVR